jgi:hypothetical protein
MKPVNLGASGAGAGPGYPLQFLRNFRFYPLRVDNFFCSWLLFSSKKGGGKNFPAAPEEETGNEVPKGTRVSENIRAASKFL